MYSESERVRDKESLPFEEYLAKYYSGKIPVGMRDWKSRWESWILDYVSPGYDKILGTEGLKKFGYNDPSMFDFTSMNEVHTKVMATEIFSRDVARFVGFMAGNGFFDTRWKLDAWLHASNWGAPYQCETESSLPSIIDIARLPFGENYLRNHLIDLKYWCRG